ncbi:MAG: M20/M25/M40 family metallo-hydrolase [Sedimentisphaerales bacterium]|nr:M20/M25/M40 family metallo-hydrolase [Sedimentisphaerales bacterium]
MLNPQEIKIAAQNLLPEAQNFLSELVQIPSTPGKEDQAMEFLHERFKSLGIHVEKVPLSDSIKDDEDYSSPVPDITYNGRYNLRLNRPGKSKGKKLLINAHVDVVPPSKDMLNPYSGKVVDGILYGRGACDDKGGIATIYLLYKLLETLNMQDGDLTAHLVVEEEVGGNGTLAMIRQGEQADACIVMEPTEQHILTSIRGAVWFRLEFFGKAGHSGQAGQTRNAVLMAKDAIDILTEYHRNLLQHSRGIELFDAFENPMPLTFGRMEGGTWPASAPDYAILEGVLGFLPNKTRDEICAEFENIIREKHPGLTDDNWRLGFTYRHDCSVLAPEHCLPQGLLAAHKALNHPTAIDAMPASCDAWFYNNLLNIPTVVYGPGALKVAHSKLEHIRLTEIADAAAALATFTMEFCR